MMFTFITLSSILIARLFDAHEYNPQGWADASNFLKEAMNFDIDPCEDFYEFVCGRWKDNPGVGFSSEIERVNKVVGEKVLKAIKGIDLNSTTTENFKKSLKTFYQQCMASPFEDIEVFVKDTYESLQKYILPNMVETNNVTESFQWDIEGDEQFWKFLGTLQHELGVPFLLEASVKIAEVDCKNKPVLYIRPVYETKLNEDILDIILKKIVPNYHNLTLNASDINDTKEALTTIREELHKLVRSVIMVPSIWNADLSMTHKIKYEDIQKELPDINWSAFIEGLLPEDIREKWLQSNPTIILERYEYFRNLSFMLKNHDRITSTNFGFLLVLQKYYTFFREGKLRSISEEAQSEKIYFNDTCLDLSVRYFSAAAFRLLCEEYQINVDKIIEEWRNDFWFLKEMVFSAFNILLQSVDWIDVDVKAILINRAKKISFYGDIPDWIASNDVIDSKTPQYFSNLSLIVNDMLAQKKLFHQQMKPLITGLMDDLPPSFPQNAYHDVENLAVRYLIGNQVPPLYQYSYPLSVKFGISGYVLAHELMHGFGTVLVPEFPHGNSPKLKNSTAETFRKRFHCTIPLYNSYCVNESSQECIFGRNTLEENIADIEGLKIAYSAYKFATQTMGKEPPLNGLLEYSSDQIFFITFGRVFCSNSNTSDPEQWQSHSPLRARAEQSLMNFPGFAKAFNCSPKSRYFRNQTCSIYGNLWE